MSDTEAFEWDDAKAASNLARHGVCFDAARSFDFEAAVIVEDRRAAYGETRWEATGPV